MCSLPDRQLRNDETPNNCPSGSSLPDRQLRNPSQNGEEYKQRSLPDRQLRKSQTDKSALGHPFTAG